MAKIIGKILGQPVSLHRAYSREKALEEPLAALRADDREAGRTTAQPGETKLVEGAHEHPLSGRSGRNQQTFTHLVRRLDGEGDGRHPLWIVAPCQEGRQPL